MRFPYQPAPYKPSPGRRFSAALCAAFLAVLGTAATAQTPVLDPVTGLELTQTPGSPVPTEAVRLRQGMQLPADARRGGSAPVTAIPVSPVIPPYVPSEFERFVQQRSGADIRRFGADLVSNGFDSRGVELSPLVPADYVIAPGDELLLTLWGSIDADLQLVVDRAGRISIPRVGTIQVSGVRNADLQEVISRRIGQLFKNFQINVSLGQLRGIRVFVTGFATRPGAYTVSSLSTVVAALMRAGGPSAAGSFRSIKLRRGAQLVTSFDLYDLLVKGDRSGDRVLQAGDVVHVGAVGPQVGVIGSVNNPAVFELNDGETVGDALRYAGGFSAVADRSRLAAERLKDRSEGRVVQLELPKDLTAVLAYGDLLQAFSAVEATLPTQRQNKRVRIDGEVARPAEYVLSQGSSIKDAVRAAGGFTSSAFVYATEFTRLSVQRTQQENYDRALRDLETDITRTASSQRQLVGDEVQNNTAALRLIDRLRTLRPQGRVVLQLQPDSIELPDLALEDGDRIYVPSRSTTVGVFGSVFNPASYLFATGRSVDHYLRLAGGATKGADEGSAFVVRANGTVISLRQDRSWWGGGSNNFSSLQALPGDALFMPEELNKTTFLQAAKDWTQILYQFGIGIAGLRNVVR